MDEKILFKNKYRIPAARAPWDYSSDGFYFVTICTKNFKEYFGKIENGEIKLSKIGEIAQKFWLEIPKHFPFVALDEFVVMPNHVHGILIIEREDCNIETRHGTENVETRHGASLPRGSDFECQQNFGPLKKNSISLMVNHYKGAVKRFCNKNNIHFFWQSRFYDHIIWTENELEKIREYIRNNILKWDLDKNNPKNIT